MTDYNDGNWHGWNGGECPVHENSTIETVWRYKDGSMRSTKDIVIARERSEFFTGNEHGDLIAFRVVEEHKEAREVFLAQQTSNGIWLEVTADVDRAVKFREVTE